MPAPNVIGRAAEVRRIQHALASAAEGASRVLVISGAAGSGKTALIDLAAASAPGGALVLRASGHEAETGIPYAGVHQLLWPVRGDVERLPEPHRRHLSRSLSFEPGTPPDPLTVAGALLSFVTLLAESRPVLIVVDDAQWLDESSRQALIFTARRLDADAVCVLFGVRSEDEDALAPIGEVVRLGPLDRAEARRMLRGRHPELSGFVAGRIIERAAGLPLLLTELPVELSENQRSGAEPLPDTFPVGRSGSRLYGRRLDRLDRNARMALLLASFDPLDAGGLREALSRSSLTAAAFETAERLGLVRLVDGVCEFTHPSVRFAVRANATARESADAHTVLAAVFGDDPGRFAFHLQRTGSADDGEVVAALAAAAERAREQGGWAEAASAWDRAARLTSSEADRRRFRAEAVSGFMRAGAGAQAASLLRSMIDQARDEVESARWRRRLAVVDLWVEGAPPPDGEELVRLGSRLASGDDPRGRDAGTELLMALAAGHQTTGDYRAAQAAVDLVRHAVPEERLSLAQRLFCDMVAVMTAGPGAGRVLRSDWIDRFDWSTGLDPGIPTGILGAVLGWMDEVEAFGRVLDHCRAVAAAAPGPTTASVAAGIMSAMLMHCVGEWDRAELEYAACERLTLEGDFLAPYPFVVLRHAYLLAARGRAKECGELRARAAATAPSWTPSYRHLDGCAEGLLHLSLGEPAEAARALEEAGRVETEMGVVVSGYTSRFPDLFEARWRLDDAESLRDELAAFTAAAERMAHPTMAATAARCRALLAGPEHLDAAFAEAIALHGRSPAVFEEARTRLLWGQRLRRARRKADARTQLRAAEAVFDRLNAAAWTERTRSELAACGERRARLENVRRSPIMQLTPREFEVAREVAAGATNSEAAGRLFVSKRTVEYHLSNAYRKLGVADRRRLAELFDRWATAGNETARDRVSPGHGPFTRGWQV